MALKSKKLENLAESIVCKRPYILWTSFGNYLAVSLQHYCTIIDDYEPEEKEQIIKIINKGKKSNGDCVINIGANIGRYSVRLAYEYGFNIIAFEPNPLTFKNLKINTVISDVDGKTDLYNIGLGNINDTLKFSLGDILCDGKAHFIIDDSQEYKNVIEVPVKRFDDLGIDREKIENTRLIIMDVEGFELNVLKGMENTLKKFHDINIIMEIWDDQKNKDTVLNLMKGLNYKAKQIDQDNWLFSK